MNRPDHPDPEEWLHNVPDEYLECRGQRGTAAGRRDAVAVPHCRTHLEFRSDCERCVAERESSS